MSIDCGSRLTAHAIHTFPVGAAIPIFLVSYSHRSFPYYPKQLEWMSSVKAEDGSNREKIMEEEIHEPSYLGVVKNLKF